MPGLIFTFAGDEAGDVSQNFAGGASRYFVFTIIGTNDGDKLRKVLSKVRSELELPDHFEFKFNSMNSRMLRERTFQSLADADFQAWSVIADKTTLPRPFELLHRLEFYIFFVTEVLEMIPLNSQKNAVLILDEFGDPEEMIIRLRRYMKQRQIPKHFRKVIAKRSDSDDLIQIADLVSGAILRRDAKQESEAYDYIQKKIVNLKEYW
jgi:hypothetical protein